MEVFKLVGRLAVDGIDKAVEQLNKADNAFERVGKRAADFGKGVQKAGANLATTGAGMTAAITAPLTAVGAAATGAAIQTQQATGRIQAQLGLTEEEAGRLTDSAKTLWAEGFGQNVGEAADAIAIVGQNMQGLNPAQLDEAAKSAMTIQEAFGEDVQASTATASVLMENFGIESEHAFDLMTAGFQSGANFSGELLDTLREYAPQFASMGMNADQMMNVLISGAEAGAFNLDKVGDAVKEFNIRAQDGSETTADGFKAIGLNADEMAKKIAAGGEEGTKAYNATIAALAAMEDPVKRNTAGVALFGTQWEDLESDVITAMSTTNASLGDVSGATEAAGEALRNNFGDQFQQTLRSVQVALEPIGLILLDMANQVLPVVEQKIEQLVNWFGSLTASQQKWIVTLGLAAAAAGPLLVVLGTLVGSLGMIITNVANAARLLNVFVRSLNLVGNGIRLVSGLFNLFSGAFRLLLGSVKVLGTALRFLALTPMGLVITAITGLVAIGIYLYKNWDTLGPKLTAIWNTIKTAVVNYIMQLVAGAIERWNTFTAATKAVFSAIGNYLSSTWNTIKTTVVNFITSLVSSAVTSWNNFQARTTAIFNSVKNFLSTTWNTIKSTVSRLVQNVRDFVVNTFENLKSRAETIWGSLRDRLITIFNNLKDRLQNLASSAKDAIVRAWQTLKDRTVQIFNDIKTALTNKLQDFATEAGKIPSKIGTAIRNKISDATGAIKELADKLVGKFKSALGISSPSKVFEGMGGDILNGLLNGLNTDNLKSLGKSVFSSFADGAFSTLETIKGFLTGSFGNIGGAGAAAARQWILTAMSITGKPMSWLNPLMTIAKRESGFNPRAINLWDSNYLAGYPSRGLFQTIPQTFASNMMAGMSDIYNPIHNAVAAIRYMDRRYGGVWNVPGIRNMARGGGYVGYEKGGIFTGPSVIRVAESSNTPVEAAVPLAGRYMHPFADVIGERIAAHGGAGTDAEPVRIVVEVPVNLDGREVARQITPEIDVELERIKRRDARARGRRL